MSNTLSDTSSDVDSDSSIDFESFGILEPPRRIFPLNRNIFSPQESALGHPIERSSDKIILAQSAELMDLRNRYTEILRPPVYTEGAVYTIKIVLQLNLIPGEICSEFKNIRYIFKRTFKKLPFGVCNKINKDYRSFGTIAMVYYSTSNQDVVLVGHQRFEVLETIGQSNLTSVRARIKIIKDITLFNPLNCLNPKKHNLGHGKMCFKREMCQSQWPSWVYKQFDVHELVSYISKKVKMLCANIEISENPIFLSFQLTKLGIFSEEQVSELLGIESTNLRLQRELQYLNNLNVIIEYRCNGPNCGTRLCNLKDLIPMSTTKLHGIISKMWPSSYQIITVLNLDDNLDIVISELPGCNCFPGYDSSIIYCRTCHKPLGWKFVVKCDVQLTPSIFYALSLNALIKMLVKVD